MGRCKVWLLPAALASAQLTLWPGVALTHDQNLLAVRVTTLLVIIALITAALGFRRHRPLAVLVVVTAAITVGGWLTPEQLFLVPGDTLLVISLADLIALFSVAVLCSRRTTALTVAAMTVWLAANTALTAGEPLDVPMGAATYVFVAAIGRIRHRWVADRTAAARRLAEAEQSRQEAAEAERRRLARELHDVTAHHLTSVVVQASAAQFLADQRPDLRDEALTFAARTGREALADLRRLVAVLPRTETAPDQVPTLADLADDFRQLGQVVILDLSAEPLPPAVAEPAVAEPAVAEPAVAEAVHGIAREALTNTLRYAPGATVRIRLSATSTGTTLLIENDGPTTASRPGVTGLGGGRGITGMHDRATALGGALHAGPRAEGGWRVHAVLPTAPTAPRRAVALRSQIVLDGALALLTLVFPLVGVTTFAEESGASRTATLLVLLAVLAHAAPLLWRRRHPWTVLAAVVLTTWLGPLLVLNGTVPSDDAWTFLFSIGADLAAVYAVAARGARPTLTWLAPVAALASTALALAVLVAVSAPETGERPPSTALLAVLVAAMTAFVAIVLVVPFGLTWLAGHATRRRRQSRIDREEGAVLTATAQAALHARDERSRVAAGLHTAVLQHAAEVPRAAEAADLAGVVEAGRQALTSMRSLLDSLDTAPPETARGPEVPSSESA